MTLTIDLPATLEEELTVEAARLNLPLSEYVLRVLASGRAGTGRPRTGAELVAYWRAESLVGTRPDIADSQEHARTLRRQADQRDRG
jgi:hypothetical protein